MYQDKHKLSPGDKRGEGTSECTRAMRIKTITEMWEEEEEDK